MLDINRIAAFVFQAPKPAIKEHIKRSLIGIASRFGADDIVIIGDHVCEGPGETVGYAANLVNIPDFITTLRETLKFLGTLECCADKYLFVINDNNDHAYLLNKFRKRQQTYGEICQIHVLGTDAQLSNNILTILGESNVEA